MDHGDQEKLTAFLPLNARERRVLGVLIEKGLTTPEYYPLTLKALTTGCNQKNNRDPVVNYDEETVADVIESLREKGLAAVVHTESGRTERYRHYVRHRFEITEPQIAVLAELMLRGRQQLGELRSRASRMVPIESLETLREAVEGLMTMGGAWATGDLSRRGIEVDHALYTEAETKRNPELVLTSAAARGQRIAGDDDDSSDAQLPSAGNVSRSVAVAAAANSSVDRQIEELRSENRALRDEIESLKGELRDIRDEFESLRRDLGG